MMPRPPRDVVSATTRAAPHWVDAKRAGEFVARFTEGRLVTIASPHYMEPAVPNEIVAEIERVLGMVGPSSL